MKNNVGNLRQQCELLGPNDPVIVISDDPKVPELDVVEVYPDTTDGHGNWKSTFKVKVKVR